MIRRIFAFLENNFSCIFLAILLHCIWLLVKDSVRVMYLLNYRGNQAHVHSAQSMRNTRTLSEKECAGETFLHILHQIQHHAVLSQACGMSAVLCKSARNIPPPSPPSLEALQKSIDGCQRCRLHAGRTHIVFGDGNPWANLMFIGEGPGEHEDLQGLPFVGAASHVR